MMRFRSAGILLLGLLLVMGCESKVQESDLSQEDQYKLELASHENVASFGAPPLIPADHDFVVGDDIAHYENGGQICLDCHHEPDEEEAPQTTHPERYNCLQCHVPARAETAGADDFKVENTFIKYTPGN
jgi:nitrate reductase cytochrome c-type subunit